MITVKYGRLLEELFARPGGEALRHRIDAMPNPEYQRLLRCRPDELRDRLPGGDEADAPRLLADLDDAGAARAPSATWAGTTWARWTRRSRPSTTPGPR